MRLWDNQRLFHQEIKHASYMIPLGSRYNFGVDTYPTQRSIVGSTIELSYRNHYITDEFLEDIEGRPEEFDPHDILTGKFKILRYDALNPNNYVVFIAVSTDYKILLSYVDTVGIDLTSIVIQYPIQMDRYIGLAVRSMYPESSIERDCTVLSCDEGEFGYSVMLEKVNGKNRYILDSECIFIINKNATLINHRIDQIASIRRTALS